MITETELAELKDAQSKLEARINAVATFEIAAADMLCTLVPGFAYAFEQAILERTKEAPGGAPNSEAAVLAGMLYELQQKRSLAAND